MKRPIDLFVALVGLLLLIMPLLILALILKLKIGGPIFFRQLRPGLHRQPFSIFKLLTMTDKRDEYKNLLPHELRITKFWGLVKTLGRSQVRRSNGKRGPFGAMGLE
jgi:lipopolysaccharide/colanic/teichoic acid biosynthesis glycosyltransferase